MPEMLPCAVSCCGAPTSRRCGACGQLPVCSLACAQAAWPEHRSACTGALEKRKDTSGDWLPTPEPILAADAPVRSKSKGDKATSAAEEPEESAAAPHAGAGKAPAEEEAKEPAALMCAYPPCDLPRIGFCTRCLLVGWCSVAHQKAHWKAGHKAACAPAETRLVPVLSWEQRIMAEAAAAAPASLAATAKLAPIPQWDLIRDGAPPTAFLKAWRTAAQGGHAGAQCALGYYNALGAGATQDMKRAVEWYAKAAAQGQANAQYNLGVCYDHGKGVAQDCKLAVEWYAKAAAQGESGAQYNLGVHYELGLGVAQDIKLAFEWFCKAAVQGGASAQFNLGVCYERGEGVAQDFKLAADWYGKAAAQGFAKAQLNLGHCHELGKGVAQDFKVAADYYSKAAAQGVAEAAVRRDACLMRLATAGGSRSPATHA